MVTLEPVRYPFETSLRWEEGFKGTISCRGKPDLQVALPPDWGGIPGIWSPEDLFTASAEVCTMTTFLWLMDKKGSSIKSYTSKATGTIQMVDGLFKFAQIVVKPKVIVGSEKDRETAEWAFSQIQSCCLVSKSINHPLKVEPEIIVEEP